MPLRHYILSLLLLSSVTAQSQTPAPYSNSSNVNYVRTWDAVKPDTSAANFNTRSSLQHSRMTTQYVDGLGRVVQTVSKQGSLATGGTANDLVNAIIYDAYGREAQQYLPFAATTTGGNTSVSDGQFKHNPFQQQEAFMTAQYGGQDETFFYGKTVFENSPLNRPSETFAPGNSWVGTSAQSAEANRRSIKIKYWHNLSTDSVRIWDVTDFPDSFGAYTTPGIYAEGQLNKTVTVDEHGKQVIEFKDKAGLVILKKVQLTAAADTGLGKGHMGWLNTYYIYDIRNRLRAVIQPVGVEALVKSGWSVTTTLLNEQFFRYGYDKSNRMIRKQVPGAGTVWMVYDERDRLVMTQDALLRSKKQWLYTTYDKLNRPVATGKLTDNTNYNNLYYHLHRADTSIAYPKLTDYTTEELTRTFYDDYGWVSEHNPGIDANLDYSSDGSGNSQVFRVSTTLFPYADTIAKSNETYTKPTGTRVKVLGTANTYLYTLTIYDDKGRPVQVKSTNQTGGIDQVTTQYSWAGQPLITIHQQQKAGTNAQNMLAVTKITYDSLYRVSKVDKKVTHSQLHNTNLPTEWTTILENEYDALGQLKKKHLAPQHSSGNGLDSLEYDYNIRGWMLGMNRSYLRDTTSGTHWFGFDLGYDKTLFAVNAQNHLYNNAQYNGNIGGMLWKSTGDDRLRKYDFAYDAANRILSADFNQLTQNSFNKNAGLDFSLYGMSYDGNGNILSMNHKGWKMGTSVTIDSLLYTYTPNNNKLKSVWDRANDTLTRLGDFRSSRAYMRQLGFNKTTSASDYGYDGNGNMHQDKNKDINFIRYNHLNLPDSIVVADTAYILYQYDAAGMKLKKTTKEGTKVTTTLYLGGSVFRNDTLELMAHEEGRIRRKDSTGLIYDYMIKDHLGNVRMLLTTEQKTDAYPVASLETANLNGEKTFYSGLDSGRVDKTTVVDYPNDTYTDPNNFTQQLSGNGYKIGAGITLKVMAGDKFHLQVKSWYKKNGATPGSSIYPLESLLGALANGIGGIMTGHGSITGQQLQDGNLLNPATRQFLNSRTGDTINKPKAFVNWVLFDEQFRLVASNSGTEQVGDDNILKPHCHQDLPIDKSGYLYIYVSNETPNINVFFDNLQVTHVRGAMLEETHYYPFGLTMAGISSKALTGQAENRYKYNGKEEQREEFSDASGLAWTDYGARMYDNQIGRWHVVDPLAGEYLNISPFTFSLNNSVRYYDPNGMEVEEINGGVHFTGEDATSAFNILTGKASNVFLVVNASQKERNQINAEDKKITYGDNWAVFSVANLRKGAAALDAFGNKSLNTLVISTHGANDEENSYISMYDKLVARTDDDVITTTEIASFNKKGGKDLQGGEADVNYLARMGKKVANGGNLILLACFTGRGETGKTTIAELGTMTGNRLTIFSPIGYARRVYNKYTTGIAIRIDGSISDAQKSGWLMKKNGTDPVKVYDVVLSTSGSPVRISTKKSN